MKRVLSIVLIAIICLTVFRTAVGNETMLSNRVLNIKFDDVGGVFNALRENLNQINATAIAGQGRIDELIELYQNRGGYWIQAFADRLPGLFSNLKNALYIISASSWVKGNDTWAIVQAYLTYIAEQMVYATNSVKLSGVLILKSAGKLIELVQNLLFL